MNNTGSASRTNLKNSIQIEPSNFINKELS